MAQRRASSTVVGPPYSIQRTVPRYSLLGVAELVETASTMCIVGKLSEISRKGCYVNTTTTLPVNTFFRIFISREDRTFMTNGKVIYVHAGVGMGLVFDDTPADQLEILNDWLADAAG